MRSLARSLAAVVLCGGQAWAQAGVADIPSQEFELPMKKNMPKHSYFLIGPKQDAETPKAGFGLLLVLPGGGGGRDFHAFVKNIYKNAVGTDWVAAQPIAVEREKSSTSVWPTQKTPGRGAIPPTEYFVEAVITDAARRMKVDPARVYLLAWSSSGPAAYAISLQKYKSVTGFFIAMSVFKPDELPSLKQAKGEAYVLYHSPDDAVCPYRMAEDAAQRLKKAEAKVEFITCQGPHGWSGDVFGSMRRGIEFLEKNHPLPDKKVWAARKKRKVR